MKIRKYAALFLAAVLFAGLLTGCSPAPGEADYGTVVCENTPGITPAQEEAPGGPAQPAAPDSPAPLQNRKLIRSQSIDAETEDLDGLLAAIDSRVAALGGYVEERNIYNGSIQTSHPNRNAYMTLRIPVDSMDSFRAEVSELSNVISFGESSEDVTLSYVATQSRITALETEETRLLELLAKAETVEDLLRIESRLTDVRTELENVTSQLRLYDNLVDFGTIYLNVQEVKTFTTVEEEPTLWERISQGFLQSLEDMGLWFTNLLVLLITRIPYLIPVALIAAVVLWIVALVNRKKKKANRPPDQTNTQ